MAVSYKEMERFMERDTFSSSLKQLEAVGFLKKTQTGGIFRKRNYFQMSEDWRRQGEANVGGDHTDGISIKGSQMHTVKEGENDSDGG